MESANGIENRARYSLRTRKGTKKRRHVHKKANSFFEGMGSGVAGLSAATGRLPEVVGAL